MALIFAATIRETINNAIALANMVTYCLNICLSAINPYLLSKTWFKDRGQWFICSNVTIECRVSKQFWVHI